MPAVFRVPRLDPRVVPQAEVEIDWSHPLAGGTTGLILLNGPGGVRDYSTSSLRLSLYNHDMTPVATPVGPGRAMNGDSNAGYQITNSAPLQSNVLTFSSLFIPDTSASTHPIIGSAASGGPEFRYDGTTGLEFLAQGVSSLLTASHSLSLNQVHHAAVTKDASGLITIYLDGVSIGSATNNYSFSFSNFVLAQGFNGPSGEPFSGTLIHSHFHNRALSATEIASLSNAPFAMLRPKARQLYAVPAAGSNPATGAASLGAVTASGSASQTNSATAAATIGSLSASATATEQDAATGAATIGAVAASGLASATNAAAGAATIGALSASGTAGLSASGSASLGGVTAAGSATSTNAATGSPVTGALAAAGIVALPATASPSIGAASAAGAATATNSATGSAQIGPVAGGTAQQNQAIAAAILGLVTASGTIIIPPVGMTQSGIQTRINRGYGIAARYLGAAANQYRPADPLNPLANKVGNLLADFDIDPLFSHKAPAPYAKPLYYGLFDATAVEVGDILVAPIGTFFVAAMEPNKPPLCVRCNATVSVLQPNDNPPGPNYYAGNRRPISTIIMAGWPASMLQGIRGEKGPVSLPGDVRMPWFNVLLPAYPNVDLTAADQITDQTGRAMTIGSVELTALGYRLTAQLADT